MTIKEQDRENMRDEMDQKNRRLDSAFTSATLMFGCALVRKPPMVYHVPALSSLNLPTLKLKHADNAGGVFRRPP